MNHPNMVGWMEAVTRKEADLYQALEFKLELRLEEWLQPKPVASAIKPSPSLISLALYEHNGTEYGKRRC